MSDRETFLARWSRRKHAAAAQAVDPAVPALAASEEPVEGREPAERTAAQAPRGDDVASAATGPDAVEPLFDPESLPPIESISADTDIRAFLGPGVPPELARAALRRAWAADPKIRDFVGLADYDWDFNAPGSMAGFGPLEMTEELREIAAWIIGPPPVAEPAADAAASSDPWGQVGSDCESRAGRFIQDMPEGEADRGDPGGDPAVVAGQNSPDAAEKSQLVVRQRHGRALPR